MRCPCINRKTITNTVENMDLPTIANISPELLKLSCVKPNLRENNKHLICDDASTNRELLDKFLQKLHCETDQAKNGFEAIEACVNNGVYKIVWMDIRMPRCDGIEATKLLRNKFAYKGIIIAVTGYVDEATRTECVEAGMNYFLQKPFDRNLIAHYANS